MRVQWRPKSPAVLYGVLSVIAATVMMVGGDALAQQTAKQQQAEALASQARTSAEQSQWDAAITSARKALDLDSENASARIALGMALSGKGDVDSAIEEFDKVTELTGRDAETVELRADAFAQRSLALYRKGEFLEAINSAYFAILERNTHHEAHNYRAMAYLEREEYDKAITSCNRALQHKEDFAEAYSNRGYAYAAKGNFKRAIDDLTKAIELDPNLAIAYQRRGAAKAAKGDLDAGSADIDKSLQIDPNLVEGLCDRALLKGMRGDLSGAMTDLDRAIEINPRFAKAHLRRGQALLAQGDYGAAITSFNKAIELRGDYADAYCYRGFALHGSRDYERAADDFTTAIELKPDFVKAYEGRSEAYKKLGEGRLARADQKTVRELNAPAEEKKEDDEETPRFVVESEQVDPKRRQEALVGAKEIDRLVAANYKKHDVTPNPRTTDEQFVRRIYLDIAGRIPTFPEARRFLNTPNPDKRSDLIDELLGSEDYASHSFNYWADVLRYTDNLNNSVRGEHYRQWIKQSLAENKPWDEMVHEMLTAEGLVWEDPATGYLQRDANMPLDNMNNTVRIFLGTRIGCAQCHDHPFDRWTQKEFYQVAAFTFGTLTRTGGGDKRYWEENPNSRLSEEYDAIEQEEEDRRRNSYRFNRLIAYNQQIVNDQPGRKIKLPHDYAYSDAKPGDVIEPATLFGDPAKVVGDEPPRHAFARWLTSKDNPRFALTIANRLWKRAFGVGQIEPVDNMMDETVAENPELMAFLESEMKRLDFDMKQYLRMIYNSETYQREASSHEVHLGEPYHFPGPVLRRMTAEQLWDSFLTLAIGDRNNFRELPAEVRTSITGVDLSSISAPELLVAMNEGQEVDRGRYQREKGYRYKGVLLARASELPSPVPADHFLRIFGQSDRELISASSDSGSVPQVLFMFNGPISHMMLEENSTMYNNVMKTKSVGAGIKAAFLTILSREPTTEELQLAMREVEEKGPAGYGNVIWSLVNTREFLFVQ
ncbi:MAG: DUF1549 domain-containing protein [Planctomycetota bacterium]|nr:MAG: DUF1549 domain-containing protein [Planctomycetota bacterium]